MTFLHSIRHLLLCGALAVLCGLLPGAPAVSAQKQAPEDQVKAQIILNFPLVVTWPGEKGSPDAKPLICALSDSPVADHLEETAADSETGEGFSFATNIALEEAGHCHVLVLTERDQPNLSQILRALEAQPVLTVGTIRHFVDQGGMIGFASAEKNIGLFSEKQVKFEINVKQARGAGLVLDPLLLELAERVVSK